MSEGKSGNHNKYSLSSRCSRSALTCSTPRSRTSCLPMTWARSCAPWASDPPRRSWWTSCTRSTRTGEQRTNQSAASGHVTPSSSLVGQVRRDRVRGVLPAVRHIPGRGSRPRDHEEGAEGRLQVVFFNFEILERLSIKPLLTVG